MPSITPDETNVKVFKAKRRHDYESSRPIYRAVCSVTECEWVYEGGEKTHPDVVKARAIGHAYKEGHAVDVRFDILNQLCDRAYPRRDSER